MHRTRQSLIVLQRKVLPGSRSQQMFRSFFASPSTRVGEGSPKKLNLIIEYKKEENDAKKRGAFFSKHKGRIEGLYKLSWTFGATVASIIAGYFSIKEAYRRDHFISSMDLRHLIKKTDTSEEERLKEIKKLIKEGADVNKKDPTGNTPLYYAVQIKAFLIVKYLLSVGAKESIFLGNHYGISPIFCAAFLGDVKMIRILLSYTDPSRRVRLLTDTRTNSKWTPLMAAVYNGHLEALKLLVNPFLSGGEPTKILLINSLEYEDEDGSIVRALDISIKYRDLEITKYLYENVYVNYPSYLLKKFKLKPPLYQAAKFGQKEIFEFLIRKGEDYKQSYDEDNRTVLYGAAVNGHHKITQIIIENFVIDLEYLKQMTKNGHWNVLESLVAITNNKNEADQSYQPYFSVKKDIFEHPIIIKNIEQLKLSITEAARTGDIELIAQYMKIGGYLEDENLISNIVDILITENHLNKTDKGGNTIAHLVARINSPTLMEKIILADKQIRRLADIESKKFTSDLSPFGDDLDSFVDQTTCRSLPPIIHKKNKSGNVTPLYHAAFFGCKDLILLFLERGAKYDYLSKNGRSPLCVAVWSGQKDIAELLINHYKQQLKKDENYHKKLAVFVNNNKNGESPLHTLTNMFENMCSEDENSSEISPDKFNDLYELAKFLLENGASPFLKKKDRKMPIHIAASSGIPKLVEILLEHHLTNVDVPGGRFDCSPLHYAIRCGHERTTELLLTKGNSDPYFKNGTGIQPIALVRKNSHIAGLIEQWKTRQANPVPNKPHGSIPAPTPELG